MEHRVESVTDIEKFVDAPGRRSSSPRFARRSTSSASNISICNSCRSPAASWARAFRPTIGNRSPRRASSSWLLAVGTVLAFVNAFLLGADVWGKGTLMSGIVAIVLIIPVFIFRHFIQDKGVFPADMLADLSVGGKQLGEREAGMLPYITLAAGVITVVIGYLIFWT